jgi:hypothetical protein
MDRVTLFVVRKYNTNTAPPGRLHGRLWEGGAKNSNIQQWMSFSMVERGYTNTTLNTLIQVI